MIRKLIFFVFAFFTINIGCNATESKKHVDADQLKLFRASFDCILKHHRTPIRICLSPSKGDVLFVNYKKYTDSQESDLAIVFFQKDMKKAVLYLVLLTKQNEILFRNYGYGVKDKNNEWHLELKADKSTGETVGPESGMGTMEAITQMIDDVSTLSNPKKIVWDTKNNNLKQIHDWSTCP